MVSCKLLSAVVDSPEMRLCFLTARQGPLLLMFFLSLASPSPPHVQAPSAHFFSDSEHAVDALVRACEKSRRCSLEKPSRPELIGRPLVPYFAEETASAKGCAACFVCGEVSSWAGLVPSPAWLSWLGTCLLLTGLARQPRLSLSTSCTLMVPDQCKACLT
jgi:hypothetical protein